MNLDNLLKLLELSFKNILNLSKILFTYYFTKQMTGNEPSADVNDRTINFVLNYALYFIVFYVVIEMIVFVLLKISSRIKVEIEDDFVIQYLSIEKVKNRLNYFLSMGDTTPFKFIREESNMFAEISTYCCGVFVVFLQLFLCTFQYKYIIIAVIVLPFCYINFVMTNIIEKKKEILLHVFDEHY